MSSAAVIQLAALAPQDYVIRGEEPDLSLWKSEITKYANYAQDIQDVELINVQFGGKTSAVLPRYGDLIEEIVTEFTLVPLEFDSTIEDASGNAYTVSGAYYSNAIGFAIISEAELEIGSTSTQKIQPENMYLYENLWYGSGRRLLDQIGRFEYTSTIEDDMIEWASVAQKIYVPLPFYNHIYDETSLALPQVALYKHDIRVKLTFNALADCCSMVYKSNDAEAATDPYSLHANLPINSTSGSTIVSTDLSARLLISYIYISEQERDVFQNYEMAYIIVQDQNVSTSIAASASSTTYQIHFSHPLIYIDWRFRPSTWTTSASRRRYSVGFKDRFDYSLQVTDATLDWDDVDHFFTAVQFNYNSHNRFPTDCSPRFFQKFTTQKAGKCTIDGYQYMWCFARNVYEYNPTSTSNHSRIDNVSFKFTHTASISACDLLIHAGNYNQGIADGGQWGVKFSS